MSSNLFKKKVKEVFNEYNRSDLQCKLNTLLFFLKKANINELTDTMNSVNRDLIMNKILEADKETLKKQNINISELRRRLTEADFGKIKQIFGSEGDVVVNKLKQLLNW